jgi:hypothetical protein
MTRMAESFFAASPLLALPIISMVLFGVVFIAITMRALRTPSDEIERRSAMPFEEDRHD